jgi:type I restriction enzyme S subunit
MQLVDTSQPSSELQEVNLAGVYSFARGLFKRGPMSPADTSYKTYNRLVPDDFVISQPKAWEGALARVTQDFEGWYLSPVFPTFRAKKDKLEPRYLEWFCKRKPVWTELQRNSRGIGARRETVSAEQFLALEIPLPPLAEQRRIVARIEELAAKIHEAQALRILAVQEAEAFIASISAKLFEPKPDWQVKTVGEFCEQPQYGYTESATEEPVGPRFLRITDIQNGCVDWNRVPYCRCPEPAKYLLKPNDLVFARTGATTGKSFVIRDCPEAVFASYLIRLRVRETVPVEYLYRYFQSPSYWVQIADEKKGTGQPNLNGSKLAKLKVPIAPPAEQRRIVSELNALQVEVDRVKALQSETSDELDALLPSILDRAFKGEL